ncbi:hypothetical protein IWQ62_000190 [Dispira parvispora]|uniref:PH domain-containing protein n=1 Tax=Dispira parvispora TaxID=1520584 RepID=A0A9W8E9G9_9FUNG|nr:hypothetical protein IWQ62_000190 [Dispira parvispora]
MASSALGPIAEAFELLQSKVYVSGVLLKRNVTAADGRPFTTKAWTPWYVELCGPVLVFWNLANMNPNAMELLKTKSAEAEQVLNQIKTSTSPNFMNITDCQIQVVGQLKKREGVFSLNSAGANFFYFQAVDKAAMQAWVVSTRLLCYEVAKLYENYTLCYLPLAHAGLLQDPQALPVRQGYLQARFTGSLDWQQYWVVLHTTGDPSQSQLFFYSTQQPSGGTPLAVINVVNNAYAIYPERLDLVDQATIAKVEGTFGAHEPDSVSLATSLYFALIMASSSQELFSWILAIYDAFHLHGRPRAIQAYQAHHPRNLYLDPSDEVVQAVQVEGVGATVTRETFDELHKELYGPPSMIENVVSRSPEESKPTPTSVPRSSAATQRKSLIQPIVDSSSGSEEEDGEDDDDSESEDVPAKKQQAPTRDHLHNADRGTPQVPALSLPKPVDSSPTFANLDESIREISQRAQDLTVGGTPATAPPPKSVTLPIPSDSSDSSTHERSPKLTKAAPNSVPSRNVTAQSRKKKTRSMVVRPVDSDSSESESDSEHAHPPRTKSAMFPGPADSGLGITPVGSSLMGQESSLDSVPHPTARRGGPVTHTNTRPNSSGTSSSSRQSWNKANPQTQAALSQDGFDAPAPNLPPPGGAGAFAEPGMMGGPGVRASFVAPQGGYAQPMMYPGQSGGFVYPPYGYPAMATPYGAPMMAAPGMPMYETPMYPEDYGDQHSQYGGGSEAGYGGGRTRQQPLTLLAAQDADRRQQQQQLLQRTGPLVQLQNKSDPTQSGGGLVGAIAARQQQKERRKYTDATSYLKSALELKSHQRGPGMGMNPHHPYGAHGGMGQMNASYTDLGYGGGSPYMAGRPFSQSHTHLGPMMIPDGDDEDDDVPLGMTGGGAGGNPHALGGPSRMYGSGTMGPYGGGHMGMDDDNDHMSLAALAAAGGGRPRSTFNNPNMPYTNGHPGYPAGGYPPEHAYEQPYGMGDRMSFYGGPRRGISNPGPQASFMGATGLNNHHHRLSTHSSDDAIPLGVRQSMAMGSPLGGPMGNAGKARNGHSHLASGDDTQGNDSDDPHKTQGKSGLTTDDDEDSVDVDDLPDGMMDHFAVFVDKYIEIKPYSWVHPTTLYNAYAASCHKERVAPDNTANKHQLDALMLDSGFSKRKNKKEEHLGVQWCDIILRD